MQAVEDIEAGVIRSASEADQLGVYVPAPTQGSLCGRIVKDWTQVVGGILTGVGLVGGGVGIALDHYPVLLGAAAATLASSLLLCMRISCLKPRKELEREVAHFKGEVERLERNEARLNAQKEALIKASDEAQASIRTLGNMLSVPANKIVRTKDQLAAIEEKLRALVDLYQRYKAVTEAFSLELKAFKSNQKVHAQTVDRLEKAVQKIDEEGLQEEVGDYQEAGAFHRQQNRMSSAFQLNAKVTTIQMAGYLFTFMMK